MADNSGIEYTDATWNPITGCAVESPGCKHCYAMKLAGTRLMHHPSRCGLTVKTAAGPVWTGEVRFNEDWLEQPIRWGRARRIFVCAHADLFYEAVPDAWIDRVFAVMALAPHHIFQVLTKRADRMHAYLTTPGRREAIAAAAESLPHRWPLNWERADGSAAVERGGDPDENTEWLPPWPLPNVWLGASVENQAMANLRIPNLLAAPAALRWLSVEPMLGAISFQDKLGKGATLRGIDWVVLGAESGEKARPMHPVWVREVRDQCLAAGVPFLFKQWGEWVPRSDCYHTFADGKSCADIDPGATRWPTIRLTEAGLDGHDLANAETGDSAYMQRVGTTMAGRLLDGRIHDGYPDSYLKQKAAA